MISYTTQKDTRDVQCSEGNEFTAVQGKAYIREKCSSKQLIVYANQKNLQKNHFFSLEILG